MKTNIPLRPALKKLIPSATLVINEKSKELINEGRNVFRLGFGQSPFPVPDEVVKSLEMHAHEKDYLPVQGLPQLRRAVSAYYKKNHGLDYPESNIMIGPGSKELMLGLQMICDTNLLLPSPSWVSYEPQSNIVGSKVFWIPTTETDKWLVTPEQLRRVCLDHPKGNKLLILNYPSNPVGTQYDKQTLQELAKVAREFGLLILSDEIYSALTFSNEHVSIANYYPEGTIISNGLSKWCGAGGWRIGTFCFPNELTYLLDTMKSLASESFSAVSAPIQFAAIQAYKGSPSIAQYVTNSNYVLKIIGSYVYDRLIKMNVTMPKAEGGFYLFPNFEYYREVLIRKGIDGSLGFCEALLSEVGVALLPGSAFGRPNDEYTCRLSYVDFDGKQLLKEVEANPAISDASIIENCPRIIGAMDVLEDWLKSL